jgi:hypothetical protein
MGRKKKSNFASIMNLHAFEREMTYFHPDGGFDVGSVEVEISEKIHGENIPVGIDETGKQYIGQRSVGQKFYRDGDEFFKKSMSRDGNPYNEPHPRWFNFSDEAKRQIMIVLELCKSFKQPVTFFGELYGPGCNGQGMTWHSKQLNIKFFSIRDGEKYVRPDDRHKYIKDADVDWVPILGRMTIKEALKIDVETLESKVTKTGLAEGIVMLPLVIPPEWKSKEEFVLKYTRSISSEKKVMSNEDKKRYHSEFVQYVTFARIEKALQQAEMAKEKLRGNKSDIPIMIKYVVADIEKEENKGEKLKSKDRTAVMKYTGRECNLYLDEVAKERMKKI